MMTAIGAGFAVRRLPPPAHPRRLQGAALPRRRRGDPRRRHQRHLRTWAGSARRMPQTAIVFVDRHAVARRHAVLRRLLLEGGDPRRGVWAGGLPVPFVMLLIAAFLTAFYMFRVVFIAFFGAPAATRHGMSARSCTGTTRRRSMALPLWILAAALDGASASTSPSSIREAEFEAPGWLTPAAVGGRLGGHRARVADVSAPGHRRRHASPTAFAPIRRGGASRFWLDDIFACVYRGRPARVLPADRLGRPLHRGRRPERAQRVDARRGRRLRRIQTGRAQDYVYGVAARRPPAARVGPAGSR